jgi:hypothetical protein
LLGNPGEPCSFEKLFKKTTQGKMSDPSKLTTKQTENILKDVNRRTLTGSPKGKGSKKSDGEKGKDKEGVAAATLYTQGITLLKSAGFHLELVEGGSHCNHRILVSNEVPKIEGINYPVDFRPLQDIVSDQDLIKISTVFSVGVNCTQELRNFWGPLFEPKAGDSDLLSYTQRKLKMAKAAEVLTLMDPIHLGHSFDPAGKLGYGVAKSPKTWVPDKDWFADSLKDLTLKDVFTIFPPAEVRILELILGRIGVGVSNHIPEGWEKPISHTARMAGVIVGKDPGLGKSTLFNGMMAAFAKCGFITQTFRSTEERFGMKATTLANIAYKDDTSLASLKKFLSSEETKTIITNGRIQVEDKFMNADQITARTVFLVNSNDWNNKFAYDLDPGIDLK